MTGRKGAAALARKRLETLTEQMFYVLLALRQERHGYGVMQTVEQLSGGRLQVGAGTLYALLERFQRDGYLTLTRAEGKRKYYRLTPTGEEALFEEYQRLRRQAADMEQALGLV